MCAQIAVQKILHAVIPAEENSVAETAGGMADLTDEIYKI